MMETNTMDSSKVHLRSTTAVSLNERFSQRAWPMMATFDLVLLEQRKVTRASPPFQIVKAEPPSPVFLQTVKQRLRKKKRRRRSVWSRLGWQQVTRRRSASGLQGFWSFRNKYCWRARFNTTHRRRGNLRRQLSWRLPGTTKVQKLSAGPRQQRAASFRGRDYVPTKKQLDAQLDEYMSLSKSRLDKELDDYMSMSRSRLDDQLDEYMSLAEESQLLWD